MKEMQRGSVLVYILITIFILGILVVSLTNGPEKSMTSGQVDELGILLKSDLNVIESSINDCVVMYPAPVDVDGNSAVDSTDNPNAPFPIYGDLSSGGNTGTAVANIKCPGAPSAQQLVMTTRDGRQLQTLKDTSTYTATYITNTTEGVLLRLSRSNSSPAWTEVISRMNAAYSTCKAAVVTAGGTCAYGCFYYWFLRRSTSVIGGEAGCP